MTRAADTADSDRVLLALADHLHEHCTCRGRDGPGAAEAPCDACDVRHGLREAREQLLAWRAAGRRLARRRDEALANGLAQAKRRRGGCDECSGLVGLATALDG